MNVKQFHKDLLASDAFAQYSLRATFFVRSLRSLRLLEAIQEVNRLTKVSASFDWGDPKSLGIEPEAWDRLGQKRITPLLVFCHSRVLSEQPRLLLYYRTVALISQKGLAALIDKSSDYIKKIEAGKVDQLDQESLDRFVVAINSVLSAIVKTAADINARDLPGYQFATAGATIQGSWNNAVGAEGEAAVKTILVNHLRDEIVQVVWRDSTSTDYSTAQHASVLDRIDEIRVVRMKGGYHLVFSSEPDVSLRSPKNIPLVAIEVKAGADPAGALERLGAAMKSFEHDRDINPRVKTVYVVTPELQKRISHGSPFDHTFGLSELLADDRTQRTFANLLLRVVLGR